MMLAHSELAEHEDYCGSRTELCATCGRYIMVRDGEIHRETNCEYPAVDQKNGSEDTADYSDFDGHFHGQFGGSVLHHDLPRHLREMLENRHDDLDYFEEMFNQMAFPGMRSRFSRPEHPFFGGMFRPSADDPPPPYFRGNSDDGTHSNDGFVTPEERNIFVDDTVTVSSDDDDGKSTLRLF